MVEHRSGLLGFGLVWLSCIFSTPQEVDIKETYDEISNYIDSPYVRPMKAAWRIEELPFLDRSHPNVRLTVHTEKDVNRDSDVAASPISQSYFFEEVRYLIFASSQRKLREYIEFLKFMSP